MTKRAKLLISVLAAPVLIIFICMLGYVVLPEKIFSLHQWLLEYKEKHKTFFSHLSHSFSHPLHYSSHAAVNSTVTAVATDTFGRVISYAGKQEVVCPSQSKDVGVLLVIGQSNSANYAEKKFTTRYPNQVLNYFDGKCYVASSPLLGATGTGGEFMTPLADLLIDNGTYKSVIIVSSGIGGSAIARWQRNGDLNKMLIATVRNVSRVYKITAIIWHQGSADLFAPTTQKDYVNAFRSLLHTLAAEKVTAPTLMSIASKCGDASEWEKNNKVTRAQRQLVDNKKVFLGVDTDTLAANVDRQFDHCHFNENGQLKIAQALAVKIQQLKREDN